MKPFLKFSVAFVLPVALLVACGPSEIKKIKEAAKAEDTKKEEPAEVLYKEVTAKTGQNFDIQTRIAVGEDKYQGLVSATCAESLDAVLEDEENQKEISLMPGSSILLIQRVSVPTNTDEAKKTGQVTESASSSQSRPQFGPPSIYDENGNRVTAPLAMIQPPAAPPVVAEQSAAKNETTESAATVPAKPKFQAARPEQSEPSVPPTPEPADVEATAATEDAPADEGQETEALTAIDATKTVVAKCPKTGGRPILSDEVKEKVEVIAVEINKTLVETVNAKNKELKSESEEAYQITIACRDNLPGEHVMAGTPERANELTMFSGSSMLVRRDAKKLEGKKEYVMYTCR
jgi:hypothetical protein